MTNNPNTTPDTRRSWPRYLSPFREPDFIVMQNGKPYLRRWWVIPRNRFLNIYLHEILQSDEDRALHDHPWANVSIILKGGYIEHTFVEQREFNDPTWLKAVPRRAGSIVFRKATAAHRLELHKTWHYTGHNARGEAAYKALKALPCWSIFITGPWCRTWGFHCLQGWVPWRKFLNVAEGKMAKGDETGPGCGE